MAIERRRPRRELTPWRPAPVEEFERRFDEMMEDMFRRPFWPSLSRREERGWLPAVDVYEKNDRIVVKAELPGMKREDIDISVSDGTLTIKGERKTEEEVKEEDYYRAERTYGSFYRTIPLPQNVDTNKIEAIYSEGVLEVDVPKSEAAKQKKVTITPKEKR